MLDRAFNISFKHLLVFTAIVLIVIAPQLIVNYFLAKGPFSVFTDQFLGLGNPGAVPPDPAKVFAAYQAAAPYFFLELAVVVFAAPVANAAVISGVSRAYLGMPVRFADCYRDALPRWLQLITLALLWIAVVFVGMLAVVIFYGIVFGALFAIASTLGQVGAIVSVVLSIAIGVILLLVVLEVYLAAAFSFVGAVLERQSAGTAFASGFRRVFGEGQLWRSLGIAAALCGVGFGVWLVAAMIGLGILTFAHSIVLQYVVIGIINSFLYPFLFAVVAVSYYDVRIRREGFDLQMLAAQLARAAAPANIVP